MIVGYPGPQDFSQLGELFKACRLNLLRRLTATALLLLVSVTVAHSASLPPTSFRSITLPNGLRAFLVERHEAPVVNVQVWYHVGSKDDAPGKTGFAHLFEHLVNGMNVGGPGFPPGRIPGGIEKPVELSA